MDSVCSLSPCPPWVLCASRAGISCGVAVFLELDSFLVADGEQPP